MRRTGKLSDIVKAGGVSDREKIGNSSDGFEYAFLTDDMSTYARRLEISRLMSQGCTYDAISKKMELSYSMVARDGAKIIEFWYEEIRANASNYISIELEILKAVHKEAWDAWQLSKRPRVIEEETESDRMGESRKTRTEHGVGDPRFLQVIMKCSEDRRKLLGLDQPERIQLIHKSNDADGFSAMSAADRRDKIQELVSKMEAVEIAAISN